MGKPRDPYWCKLNSLTGILADKTITGLILVAIFKADISIWQVP